MSALYWGPHGPNILATEVAFQVVLKTTFKGVRS